MIEGERYVYECRIRDRYFLIILTAENSFFRAVEENLMEELFIAREKELRNSLEIVMNPPRAWLLRSHSYPYKEVRGRSTVTVTIQISDFEKELQQELWPQLLHNHWTIVL